MNKLKVIELEGLAPSLFCGAYFADQGAEVIYVTRPEDPFSVAFHKKHFNRNKKCVGLNFKDPKDFEVLKQLIKKADIIIDPFRPGVLQKMKLGPKDLFEINKRVILLRVSGYGQTGKNRERPGHDLNYISVSGIVPLISQQGQYQFPSNYLADFVAASLGITGVLGALQLRQKSGEGGVLDSSLTEGCVYLAQNLISETKCHKSQSHLMKTFKIEGKEYLVTGRDCEKVNQSKILELLKGKDYYGSKNDNLEISVVKEIDVSYPNQFPNPFGSQKRKNDSKNERENSAQIFKGIAGKL